MLRTCYAFGTWLDGFNLGREHYVTMAFPDIIIIINIRKWYQVKERYYEIVLIIIMLLS